MNEKVYYTIKQVAEMLGVHRTTVYDWMNERGLIYVQIGGRRRIPKEALEAFIKSGQSSE